MAPFDVERQFFSESFRFMAACPLCQTKYQPQLAKVLAEKDDACLLHVPCAKCHSAMVAMIVTNVFGMQSVGVLTDLTSEEVLSKRQEQISADDVLRLYEAVKNGSILQQS